MDENYYDPSMAHKMLRQQAEIATLQRDIARHVQIAAEQAQEVEELRADLAAARALLIELRDEWIDPSFHMAPHLIARIDAALAGRRNELHTRPQDC